MRGALWGGFVEGGGVHLTLARATGQTERWRIRPSRKRAMRPPTPALRTM
ncbi:hypothetical protein SAMN05446935_5399 [Burkholderia sp. YR290]|nr:hypothetical protein SAMN05446935_5399 [Burkholderia sp. YR290]